MQKVMILCGVRVIVLCVCVCECVFRVYRLRHHPQIVYVRVCSLGVTLQHCSSVQQRDNINSQIHPNRTYRPVYSCLMKYYFFSRFPRSRFLISKHLTRPRPNTRAREPSLVFTDISLRLHLHPFTLYYSGPLKGTPFSNSQPFSLYLYGVQGRGVDLSVVSAGHWVL